MDNEAPPLLAEPVLVEWFDDHWYKVAKERKIHWCASVTTKGGMLAKESLARWRGDVGNREADFRMYEQGQRGKRLHWAREMLLTGGVVVYDPWQHPIYTDQGIIDLKAQYNGKVSILRTQDEMVQIYKLKRQLDILKPKIIAVESLVYDLENKDAGTIDGVYWIDEGDYLVSGKEPIHFDGGLYIDDFKTGNYLDDDVWLQEAPYGFMYEKMHGMKIAGAMCTWTGAKIKSGIAGLKTLVRPRKMLMEKDYPDFRHVAALWERHHGEDEPATFEFPALLQLQGGDQWAI